MVKPNFHLATRGIPAVTLLLAGGASAGLLWSQTTASMQISVVDSNGLSVKGHRVVVESRERAIQRAVVTNERGEASLAGLLPGIYYIGGNAIRVRASELSIVKVRLVPAEATVTIEASPVLAETSSVGVQTTFAPQDLVRLPLPTHRYVEYSYLAPGISPSGRPEPVSLGSMMDSNAFVIDGMTTNLTNTGRFGLNISSEIIESQTLTTGGHKAEIGQTAGASFSIVTKSGTNEFHGSAVGYLISRNMNTRPYEGLANTPEERSTDGKEWAITIGGPIIKDRLFFFGAYNQQISSLDYENIRPVGGEPRTRSQEEDRSYRFFKLTWMVNDQHRLEAAYFGDPVTQTSFNTAGDAAYKDEQMSNRDRGGDSFLLHHVGGLTQWLTWENTLGLHKTHFYWYPTTPGVGEFRSQLDAPASESFGRYSEERMERQQNLSLRSELTMIVGPHRAKGGIQMVESEYTLAFARPSGGMSYNDRAAGGNGPDGRTLEAILAGLAQYNNGDDFGYDGSFSLATASPVSGQLLGGRESYLYQRTIASMAEYGSPMKSSIYGVFAQDDFQLSPKWVLNLGIRYDQVKMEAEDGRTVLSEGLISPRLGVSWDPTARGKTRIFAYYGRIYSPPVPGNFASAGATTGGPEQERQVWIPNPTDPTKGEWKTWQKTGVQGVNNVAVADDLSTPTTDMLQLGLERMHDANWTFEAVATVKRVRNLIDTYDKIYGYLPELHALADTSSTGRVVANLPGLKRDFFGIDLAAHRRFEGNHRLQFSYSFGSLTGNSQVGNVNSITGGNTTFARIPSLREDYRLPQYYGEMNESLAHSLKAFGSAMLPCSFELSGVWGFRTGMHYTPLTRTGGYDLIREGAKRGDQTLPGVFSLDLALAYNVRLTYVNVRIAAEVFNVTNDQPMTKVENRDTTFTPGNYQQPRALQFSLRASF